jgi:hypothetical protein
MPDYEFYCTECDSFWSVFMTMENYLDCDPDKEKPSTLERYMGNVTPRVKISGVGVYRPGSF